MKKYFKIYGISPKNEIITLTKDMCMAILDNKRVNIQEEAKNYFTTKKLNKIFSACSIEKGYGKATISPNVNWNIKTNGLIFGYSIDIEKAKEYVNPDTKNQTTETSKKQLYEIGDLIRTSENKQRRDGSTYVEREYWIYRGMKDDLILVSDSHNKYEHTLSPNVKIDKLELGKIGQPYINIRGYRNGENIDSMAWLEYLKGPYGTLPHISTIRTIRGVSGSCPHLFYIDDDATPEFLKYNVKELLEIWKKSHKKDTPPITIKAADALNYVKGVGNWRYGAFADYQTEEDRHYEELGSSQIKKFEQVYKLTQIQSWALESFYEDTPEKRNWLKLAGITIVD